jgi:hypothetical protein
VLRAFPGGSNGRTGVAGVSAFRPHSRGTLWPTDRALVVALFCAGVFSDSSTTEVAAPRVQASQGDDAPGRGGGWTPGPPSPRLGRD